MRGRVRKIGELEMENWEEELNEGNWMRDIE